MTRGTPEVRSNKSLILLTFGDWPFSSFIFDIYLGTSWTQPTTVEWFTIESISIQVGCREGVNEIKGRVEH